MDQKLHTPSNQAARHFQPPRVATRAESSYGSELSDYQEIGTDGLQNLMSILPVQESPTIPPLGQPQFSQEIKSRQSESNPFASAAHQPHGSTIARDLFAQIDLDDHGNSLRKSSDLASPTEVPIPEGTTAFQGFRSLKKTDTDWELVQSDGNQQKMTIVQKEAFAKLVAESKELMKEMGTTEVKE